jgi:hypothetical protein
MHPTSLAHAENEFVKGRLGPFLSLLHKDCVMSQLLNVDIVWYTVTYGLVPWPFKKGLGTRLYNVWMQAHARKVLQLQDNVISDQCSAHAHKR